MHAALTDILADIVQNSVEAGARHIGIALEQTPEAVTIRVEDDGKGMDDATLARAVDPFWSDGIKHPGRKVGLGLPFLRQTAEACGGEADIASVPGDGTTVRGVFPEHWDRPPLGDVVLLWLQCLTFEGDYGMSIRRSLVSGEGRQAEYSMERDEVSDALGGLEDAGALGLLKEFLTSQEESLFE